MAKDFNIYAKLVVDESEWPISSFRYASEAGSLGDSVECELADPEAVVTGDNAMFMIGIEVAGSTEWINLIEDGFISGSKSNIQWLEDRNGVLIVSRMAEKWNLSPDRQVVVYNPDTTDPVTLEGTTPLDLIDENYQPIEPLLVPIANLDLHKLMNFVYVDKLGFPGIVTNIQNFELNTINIGIEQTWQSAVAQEIGLFEPKYSVDSLGNLRILDVQGTLPADMPVRKSTVKNYAKLSREKKNSQKITHAILEFTDNFVGQAGAPTARTQQITIEVGTYGQVGWQRTQTTKHFLDFKEDPQRPDEITRTVLESIENIVSARADELVRPVSIHNTAYTYAYDYKLQTGYVKSVSLYCKLPGTAAKMRAVQTETSQIQWEGLKGTPGEFIKAWEVVDITGLVLETTDDPATRTALFVANKLNEVPDSEDGVTVLTNRAISTKIDVYRFVARDQIEVTTQRVNHLQDNAPTDSDGTFQHTGTIQVRASGSKAFRRRMIIAGPNPEPRRAPITISAGNIPLAIARLIVDRILAREGEEPEALSVELAGLDLTLRKGSLRKMRNREDEDTLMFVAGLDIVGSELGTPNFDYTQSYTGVSIDV